MESNSRRSVYWCGVGLFVGGLVLFFTVGKHYSSLLNYQRLALMLPLVYSIPLLSFDTLANWSTASRYDRIRAMSALICAIILTIGFVYWLLVAPEAKAGG